MKLDQEPWCDLTEEKLARAIQMAVLSVRASVSLFESHNRLRACLEDYAFSWEMRDPDPEPMVKLIAIAEADCRDLEPGDQFGVKVKELRHVGKAAPARSTCQKLLNMYWTQVRLKVKDQISGHMVADCLAALAAVATTGLLHLSNNVRSRNEWEPQI